MFGKKYSNLVRLKKRTINTFLILFIIVLGVGYAAFESNLTIGGTLAVKKYDHTLYNVIKKESLSSGLSRKYTGEHGDSMDSTKSTKDIYHWYANTDAEASQIMNKNNVIFAGQCWQMIRTTDTGGVKMIYNGEADNNKCLNTRGNHVGYASSEETDLSGNYWYGTDYTYDKTNQVFSLSGTTEQSIWNGTTASNLVGKYTCLQAIETDTCTTLHYVNSVIDNTYAETFLIDSNSHYSQFGTLEYDNSDVSLANLGYMTNIKYYTETRNISEKYSVLNNRELSLDFWYADSYEYGTVVPDQYSLVNPYQLNSTSDYSNLVGKYTILGYNSTDTDNGIYYIMYVNGNRLYGIRLDDNHPLSYYYKSYVFGDSYTDNGNGTYTVNNYTTVNTNDWYNDYNNIKNKYGCVDAVNGICNNIWYVTNSSNSGFEYEDINTTFKFGESFTYSNGVYTLSGNTEDLWDYSLSDNRVLLNNAHYTCFNSSGQCTSLNYIYYVHDDDSYYVVLNNGENINTAVNAMLYDNNVNINNSTIKSGIDAWYRKYLMNYSSYLDDVIYCNNRNQSNQSGNGWNSVGGNIRSYMRFSTNFLCQNETDKFSLTNNKAKLDYAIGLITFDEINLMNNLKTIATEKKYWTMSSNGMYYDYGGIWLVYEDGSLDEGGVSSSQGVRPVITLVSGTLYNSGDGSKNNPYIIN